MPSQENATILSGPDHQEGKSQWKDEVLWDSLPQEHAVHDLLFMLFVQCACNHFNGASKQTYFDQWPALRSYPVAFGLHVQRILPKLIQGTSAKPQLPIEPDGGWDVPKLFQTMQFNLNDWEEAKLIECCTYLRGSKALKVPEKWKRVFPKSTDLGVE